MNDRTVRRLRFLEKTASSARVLNLRQFHRAKGSDSNIGGVFFQNAMLDTSIIVKHRVRDNEKDYFQANVANATKIILPLDRNDLKIGGRFIMVGQKQFDEQAFAAFGSALAPGSRDRQVLNLLDELPSLDPFLVREQLRRNGFDPARGYFNVSDADIAEMRAFIEAEIATLVQVAVNDASKSSSAMVSRLVAKLMDGAGDGDLGPLRDVLRLSDAEYLDGVFAWRGFLYFKWVYHSIAPATERLRKAIKAAASSVPANYQTLAYINGAVSRLDHALAKSKWDIGHMLARYDRVYRMLVHEQNPVAFSEFLLTAPADFVNIGQPMGVLQHMISFWRFRFQDSTAPKVSRDDLADLLLDFEQNMGTYVRDSALFAV